ncbi:MAG: glycosyltransferase family 4 protein [Candidatus Cloacimonetes bacterium]|nr:glycosyltransferase family 4 protein [Candidatus Cloacimonadota bacterium]
MKILMILENSFNPDVRVEKEIRALSAGGHEVTLACSSIESSDQIVDLEYAKILKKKMPKYIYKLSTVSLLFPFYFNFWRKYLKKIFNDDKFNAIHLHDLPLSKVAFEYSQMFKIPLIIDLHENRPEIMKLYQHVRKFPGKLLISIKQWQKYQQKYIHLADNIILTTEEAKEYYIQNYSLEVENISVIPNYVELEVIRKLKIDRNIIKKYEDKFTIVYFGDTGVRRGTSTIIQTANLLRKYEDIHFILIGKSKDDQLLTKALSNYKLQNVELLGWLPIEKAISYIAAAKTGICPFLRNIHHDTTYANKMFQYMAFGKPVIVSDCIAQKKLVLEQNFGLVFKANNAKELAKAVLNLRSGNDYHRLSQNSLKAIETKFNWNASAQQLNMFYQELR